MALKAKRKVRPSGTPVLASHPQRACGDFLDMCHQLEDGKTKDFIRFIQQKFYEVFGQPVPNGWTYEWLKIKIAYKLIFNGYEKVGKLVPERVRKQYELSQSKDTIEQLEETCPTIQNGGYSNMAKKTVKAKKVLKTIKPPKTTKTIKTKTATMRVHEGWLKIMKENFTKKLSDKKLAEVMHKMLPNKKKYTEADIRDHRAGYNRGAIKGQTGVPKFKLKQYN